jgi:hypothetical protein
MIAQTEPTLSRIEESLVLEGQRVHLLTMFSLKNCGK